MSSGDEPGSGIAESAALPQRGRIGPLLARAIWWAGLGVPLGDVAGLFVLMLGVTIFLCFPIAIYRSAQMGPATFVLLDGRKIVTTSPAETARVLQQNGGAIRTAEFERKGPFRSDNVMLASFVAMPCSFIAWTVWAKGRRLRRWFRIRPRALALGAAGGIVLVGAGFLWQAAVTAAGHPPPDVAAFLRDAFPRSVVIAVGGILAPLGEEMYFRGRLLDLLDARIGRTGSALLSAAAFGLLHGIPILFPILFAFGVVLAGLRRLSGGLLACVLAHMINNLLGLLLLS